MSKYRLEKARGVVHPLVSHLSNNNIPLEYRLRIIKNVIKPILSYVSALYGMNMRRVYP